MRLRLLKMAPGVGVHGESDKKKRLRHPREKREPGSHSGSQRSVLVGTLSHTPKSHEVRVQDCHGRLDANDIPSLTRELPVTGTGILKVPEQSTPATGRHKS